jgi:hypothetical protein
MCPKDYDVRYGSGFNFSRERIDQNLSRSPHAHRFRCWNFSAATVSHHWCISCADSKFCIARCCVPEDARTNMSRELPGSFHHGDGHPNELTSHRMVRLHPAHTAILMLEIAGISLHWSACWCHAGAAWPSCSSWTRHRGVDSLRVISSRGHSGLESLVSRGPRRPVGRQATGLCLLSVMGLFWLL